MAPVHCAAGSDGETNFGMTSLAAPKAASSRVARYSFTARLASSTLLVPFPSRNRTLLVRVRHDQAGIDRKPFAADKPCRDARLHHTLKDTAENLTVAKPLIASTRERGMIRDLVFDREPAEPAIGEVHLHVTAQRSLRADGEHIADDQHADHQLGINRGPTIARIMGRELGMDPRQVENRSYLANQVIVRNSLFKAK